MVIPRIKISLTFNEILSFLFSLWKPKREKDAQKIINQFEVKFSERYNYPQAVSFSKARTAFFHLLKKLDMRPDSEIIISGLHVADFINMILLAGFRPVVVDVSPTNYEVDFDDLKNKITKKTGLILVTHLCGFPTDMDQLTRITTEANVPFVEDCSQAFFASWKGKFLGTFGIAGIFSLSLAKPICTMKGGIVISRDENLLRHLRNVSDSYGDSSRLSLLVETFKNFVIKIATSYLIFKLVVFPLLRIFSKPLDFFSQFQKSNKKISLRHAVPKYLYEPFSWQQALLGLKQLNRINEQELARKKNGRYLYEHLHSSSLIRKPDIADIEGSNFWLFPLITANSFKVKSALSRRNIDSSGYLLSCLSEEKAFRDLNFKSKGAKLLKKNTIFVPMYPSIQMKELNHMISVLNSIG